MRDYKVVIVNQAQSTICALNAVYVCSISVTDQH